MRTCTHSPKCSDCGRVLSKKAFAAALAVMLLSGCAPHSPTESGSFPDSPARSEEDGGESGLTATSAEAEGGSLDVSDAARFGEDDGESGLTAASAEAEGESLDILSAEELPFTFEELREINTAQNILERYGSYSVECDAESTFKPEPDWYSYHILSEGNTISVTAYENDTELRCSGYYSDGSASAYFEVGSDEIRIFPMNNKWYGYNACGDLFSWAFVPDETDRFYIDGGLLFAERHSEIDDMTFLCTESFDLETGLIRDIATEASNGYSERLSVSCGAPDEDKTDRINRINDICPLDNIFGGENGGFELTVVWDAGGENEETQVFSLPRYAAVCLERIQTDRSVYADKECTEPIVGHSLYPEGDTVLFVR